LNQAHALALCTKTTRDRSTCVCTVYKSNLYTCTKYIDFVQTAYNLPKVIHVFGL